MESWTTEHNTYLSYLLDDVTGTEEIVKMNKDNCRINDCFSSINADGVNVYFTGSKAEGLDLPGSDIDFMIDINYSHNIEVSESTEELVLLTCANKLLIVTDNVPPAFALLKCVRLYDKSLSHAIVSMSDNEYLSSLEFLSSPNLLKSDAKTRRIQGPSIETWNEFENTSESGKDNVPSILCKSWPTVANEWKDRPRHYGWPTQHDKESIEAFGCHLVPIGHPLSTKRHLQWRLSFSIAERTLVWSFNHTQLQCYALMKLILKDFVKSKCTEKHKNVLCSYFIKTFIFWQFESTDPLFWQQKNLSGCIIYLIRKFYNCIQTGILRHYFVPCFNLLDIKLTQDAQTELLYLFGKVREYGISILGQCNSLSGVFLKLCKIKIGIQSSELLTEILRRRILNDDELAIGYTVMNMLGIIAEKQGSKPYEAYLSALVQRANEGHVSIFSDFVMRHLCRLISTYKCYHCIQQGNKLMYFYMKSLDKNIYGTDIASCKLWLSTFLFQMRDYCRSLRIINHFLSSIPPYAQYYSVRTNSSNDLSKQLYVDTYCTQNSNIKKRAKEAWLSDMFFAQEEFPFLPRAIQVELYYSHKGIGVFISPFTYTYYLMFLCYHGLGQYDNRDRALRQLVDTVNDDERCSIAKHHSYNIAGHCLLMVGNVETARDMFLKSAQFTQSRQSPAIDKYNSAYKYLSLL